MKGKKIILKENYVASLCNSPVYFKKGDIVEVNDYIVAIKSYDVKTMYGFCCIPERVADILE